MCDVVGRLLNSCISHLVGRRTTKIIEDASCDCEYNTGDARHDEHPLPLSVEMKNEMNGLKEDIKEVEKMIENKKAMDKIKDISYNDENEPKTAIELRMPNANAGRVDGDDEEDTSDQSSWVSGCPKGKPKERGSWILWKERDDIIRKMQADRVSKDEETPSFWNYDPRCLAKEFIGLDQKSFLTDSSAFNICFFDKDILRNISKMLSPMDFLNLSYTCRFLHWRLFTFCTCYAPYRVLLNIYDFNKKYDEGAYKATPNKTVCTSHLDENDLQLMSDLPEEEGLRAVVARIPSCLRRPFFFDELIVDYNGPFFTKDDFDRCLLFILPARKYARQLHIEMNYTNPTVAEKFNDYQAVNDFFQTINATSYLCRRNLYWQDPYCETLKVFEKCPYARVMDCVDYIRFDNHSKWENIVLLNRIGHYLDPPVSAIIRTIEEFKYGTANLDYHEYEFNDRERKIAFLEYVFANYDKVEYYQYGRPQSLWKTGRRHMMAVSIYNDSYLYVAIGKEETLKKRRSYHEDASSKWYRIETALEPEEGDKAKAAGDNAS